MKRISVLVLAWVSLAAAVLFLLAATILLLTGQAKGASVFVIPCLGLFLAGSNLRTYAKRKPLSDKDGLSKG